MLIDKPYRWTSFDALNKVRRLINTKIGHCGTLDPLATGLLICCTGKKTKEIENYQKQPKEYTGIIQLGATTPTYDLESEPTDLKPFEQLTEEEIRSAAAPFTGNILQTPPAHSAIKKDGKRAYEMARKGIEMKLEPRPVTISEFEITKIENGEVHFRIGCSTGTYIRSLANDFGAVLGCGGYLKELRRTKIGNFSVDDAPGVSEWVEKLKDEVVDKEENP
jgi:tRNA pseudouridine55 synthase